MNMRLDRALALHPKIQTRSRAAKLISSGSVLLKGKAAKASHQTSLGEQFEIYFPPPEAVDLKPLPLALDLVHEDKDLIVVNKPAGLVVHPAAGHAQDTLVNALLHHTKDLAMGFGEKRPGLVHRLDRNTSGLLVIAKNDFTQTDLAAQFKVKSVHRLYWALVYGKPINKRGKLESFLKRHPTDRKRFASEKIFQGKPPSGKRAVTHFEVIKSSPAKEISLLHFRLETGRTHQIRVHISELGHPILGDLIYGSTRKLKSVSALPLRTQISELHRLALHAAELGFIHPTSKQFMLFRTPWPDDLKELLRLVFPDEVE